MQRQRQGSERRNAVNVVIAMSAVTVNF